MSVMDTGLSFLPSRVCLDMCYIVLFIFFIVVISHDYYLQSMAWLQEIGFYGLLMLKVFFFFQKVSSFCTKCILAQSMFYTVYGLTICSVQQEVFTFFPLLNKTLVDYTWIFLLKIHIIQKSISELSDITEPIFNEHK